MRASTSSPVVDPRFVMTQDPSAGYIYLLINYSMPGLVKVGRTARAPVERLDELSSATGVPTPFTLVYDVLVPDCALAERAIHDALTARGYRTSQNREFFRAPIYEVVRLMIQVRESMQSASVAAALQPSRMSSDLAGLLDDGDEFDDADRDKLFREAAVVCIRGKGASTSLLQRSLGVGYGRAARIIDQLHAAGVVGPPNGSGPREILARLEDLDRITGGQ